MKKWKRWLRRLAPVGEPGAERHRGAGAARRRRGPPPPPTRPSALLRARGAGHVRTRGGHGRGRSPSGGDRPPRRRPPRSCTRQFPAGPSLRPTRLHRPRRLALRRERNRPSSRRPRLRRRRRLRLGRPPRLRKRRERRWPRCWERVCRPWVREWRRRRRLAPRRQRTAILRIGSDSY